MKPFHSFIFLISVFVAVSILMFVFPAEGLKISDDLELKFISFDKLFNDEEVEYKDITAIVGNVEEAAIKDINFSWRKQFVNESIAARDTFEYQHYVLAEIVEIDINSLNGYQLQFPDSSPDVLYTFFEHLRKNRELIRIMHYGDSQIEGDRMTSFIRNRMQSQFGGGGVGLVPGVQVHNYGISMKHEVSTNWLRYTLTQHGKKIEHRRFGALATFSRFAPVFEEDTVQIDTTEIASEQEIYQAWIRFSANKRSYSNHRKFTNCRLFYGYNKKPVLVELLSGETVLATDTLQPTDNLAFADWTVNSPAELTIRFSGEDSPDIYGISLDGNRGVAVDNIALRGSSGTIFNQMNQGFLGQMYANMNIKLFVLQFGGNVTPYITDTYNYYEKMFYAQLVTLKRLVPDAVIITIGPADMSRKIEEHYESYPNIPKIRNALRSATFRAGGAFWDMYAAMGGENSMPSWVQSGLASPDYTHFSHKGAKIISQMFYNALISEYNVYVKNSSLYRNADGLQD